MDSRLKELLTAQSPSGFEKRFQQHFARLVRPFVDEVSTDKVGNIIATVNPNASQKVMVVAHGDEIGFLITRIEKEGYLRCTRIGGISAKVAPGMKVRILKDDPKDDVFGVFGVNAEHLGGLENPDFENLFIDIGATNEEDAKKKVSAGDYAVYTREPVDLVNNKVAGRGLDDRICVYMLLRLAEKLSQAQRKPNLSISLVSSVAEEVNGQGAHFSSAAICPNLAIVCDVTFAIDHPNAKIKERPKCELSKGPAISIGSPINKVANKVLEDTAKEKNIPIQYNVDSARTGTDADTIRYVHSGIPCVLVSLPLRYMHSPVETADMGDVENQATLIFESLYKFENMDLSNGLNPFTI